MTSYLVLSLLNVVFQSEMGYRPSEVSGSRRQFNRSLVATFLQGGVADGLVALLRGNGPGTDDVRVYVFEAQDMPLGTSCCGVSFGILCGEVSATNMDFTKSYMKVLCTWILCGTHPNCVCGRGVSRGFSVLDASHILEDVDVALSSRCGTDTRGVWMGRTAAQTL